MSFKWSKYVHDNILSSFNEFFDEIRPKYVEVLEEGENPNEHNELYVNEYPIIDNEFITKLSDIIGEELCGLLKTSDTTYKIRLHNIENQISVVDIDMEKFREFYNAAGFSQKRAIMYLFASPFHIINNILDDYSKELFHVDFETYYFTKLPRIILSFDDLFGNFSLYDCLTNPFLLDTQLLEFDPDEIADDKCEATLQEIAGVI